ncbi:hypothetical protein FDZ74_05195 [bacterium]|nr:MAG: hypothetical protein FDZ74_05195 [bacterium]
MATEIQKKEKTEEIEGVTIFGLAHGMWELFGDASFATSIAIGDTLLARLERESGLEIQGETPEHILVELVRLFTDESEVMKSGKASLEGDRITFSCENCFFIEGTAALDKFGVQPFYCPVYNITTAAMRQRMGRKGRFVSRKWDEASKTCTLEIQLMQ